MFDWFIKNTARVKIVPLSMVSVKQLCMKLPIGKIDRIKVSCSSESNAIEHQEIPILHIK